MAENDNSEGKLRAKAIKYREKLEKRGVMYLSRVPPGMKPNKLRALLEPYGEITRLFMAPEDEETRLRRKRAGKNGSRLFAEGWIEYSSKKTAKTVALSLNLTPIERKKGAQYYDDLWNLKYLKGFKWEHLTEKAAYERRVRESKMQAAMQQAKRRNAEIADLIEQSKVQKHIEKRKRARESSLVHSGDRGADDGAKGAEAGDRDIDNVKVRKRNIFQKRAWVDESGIDPRKVDSALLGKLFPSKQKQKKKKKKEKI